MPSMGSIREDIVNRIETYLTHQPHRSHSDRDPHIDLCGYLISFIAGANPELYKRLDKVASDWVRDANEYISNRNGQGEAPNAHDDSDINPYMNHGYADREDYLGAVAEYYETEEGTVQALADMLGPDEDFDSLLSTLADEQDCEIFTP